jgi:hypothetical protein
MVLGFLEEFAALPLDSLTPADACAKVLALRNKVPAHPYNLHTTPYTLHPTPYKKHPTSYTLHPAP